MKICMIGHKSIPSRAGGVEVVVEELSTRMASQGHDVTVYNRRKTSKEKDSFYKGVKIKSVFTMKKKALNAIVYSYFATKLAIKLAKKGQYDVIHFHAEGQCNFLKKFGKIGSKKRNRMPKIIVTIHGLDWQRGKWGGLARRILLRGEKHAAKYADEIIVLSQNNKQYFKDVYSRETSFIPNGVSPAVLHEPQIIKEQWGLEKNKYILFLARIVPEKGVHYLIEAWKRIIIEMNTDKKLVIAGGMSDSQDYFNEIKKMVKDEKSIIMTDFVSGQTLQELYSNAYLYVLPSDVEGMPMSLLEAMSYGNSCLVSNISENVEIINEMCFTFEKANVDSLTSQLKHIIELNHNSHGKSIQTYTWEDVVDQTINIYQ